MSEVNISIVSASALASTGGSALVEVSECYGLSETITSNAFSGSAVVTSTLGASGAVTAAITENLGVKRLIWRVANLGADHIYVAFGTTPDAKVATATGATTARKGIPAGSIAYFSVRAFGDKVAVINAT